MAVIYMFLISLMVLCLAIYVYENEKNMMQFKLEFMGQSKELNKATENMMQFKLEFVDKIKELNKATDNMMQFKLEFMAKIKELNKATDLIREGVSVIFKGEEVEKISQVLSEIACNKCKGNRPRDCSDLDKASCPSGVYEIFPAGNSGFKVFCEMRKDGGGWTVIQRRQDGTVDFCRDWNAYKNGFGSIDGEFWLGNDHIHQIAAQGSYELRIDLEDFSNEHAFAKYSKFSVESENNKYKLHVSGYSGDAGDSFFSHNGNMFTTKDSHNDATLHKGGWWYGFWNFSNLNALYHRGIFSSYDGGVFWFHWKEDYYSLKTTVMMIRKK